jgi:hypothetical protein
MMRIVEKMRSFMGMKYIMSREKEKKKMGILTMKTVKVLMMMTMALLEICLQFYWWEEKYAQYSEERQWCREK